MMLDGGLGFATRPLTDGVLQELTASRVESHKRILEEAQKAKAKQMLDSANGNAYPSMEVEVYCPELTDDGFPIVYKEGAVKIERKDRVMKCLQNQLQARPRQGRRLILLSIADPIFFLVSNRLKRA